jgi:molybdopterin synthase sulfur carrier subunit
VRTERGLRAGVWRFADRFGKSAGSDYSSNEVSGDEQVAPGVYKQIGYTQIGDAQNAPDQEVIVPVTFHIPGALREFTGGHSQVAIEASPATVGEALAALWKAYPGVRDRIATEQGQIREHINIFVGNEDIRYAGGLMTPVSAESQISIVPAISGG